MMRRLWLADQLLRDGIGHHAGYNRCIAEAAASAGCEALVVSHRDLDPQLVAPHRVVKLFHTDWRANPPAWISNKQELLRGLEKISAVRFRSDLRQLGKLTSPDDLVFAQMIAPRHLSAWLDWMKYSENPPRVALHLGYQPHRFARPDVARSMELLPEHARRRTFFVTDSEKLVEPLQNALGVTVYHLPHVVNRQFAAARFGKPGSITLFAPGNARREKGFADLLAALEEVRDLLSSGKLRFRVQCHHPDHFCRELLAKRPILPSVEWIDRPLDDVEYVRAIEDCDIVLVPYHLDHYAARTSGVFCEARVAGKPVVATSGSWAGDRVLREGGGWLCNEKSPLLLARTLREIADASDSVPARAAALQSGAHNEFSARNFFEGLSRIAWSN